MKRTYLKPIMLTTVILLTLACSGYSQAAGFVRPEEIKYPIRDVLVNESGDVYLISMHWSKDRPFLTVFTSEGEPRDDFELKLPNFCCEPFPLKIVQSMDGFIYVLLPGKEGMLFDADLQLVRINETGEQDDTFGDNGVLGFPNNFRLKDFDVSPTGQIWVLDYSLNLYRFDEPGMLIKIRELQDIFPETLMGGRFEGFAGRNLFTMSDDRILLMGNLKVAAKATHDGKFFSVMELDRDGRMVNHLELDKPWFPKSSDKTSFFSPLNGKSIIRSNGTDGSVLGFMEGIRDEPDPRKIALIDWTLEEKFGFYNIVPLELPKEVFLGYDMNRVFFVRKENIIKLFFPFFDRRIVLMVDYNDKGEIISKIELEAFR